MAVHLKFYDETGFETSDYVYADNAAGKKRAGEVLSEMRSGKSHDGYFAVAVVEDGKEVSRAERPPKTTD